MDYTLHNSLRLESYVYPKVVAETGHYWPYHDPAWWFWVGYLDDCCELWFSSYEVEAESIWICTREVYGVIFTHRYNAPERHQKLLPAEFLASAVAMCMYMYVCICMCMCHVLVVCYTNITKHLQDAVEHQFI